MKSYSCIRKLRNTYVRSSEPDEYLPVGIRENIPPSTSPSSDKHLEIASQSLGRVARPIFVRVHRMQAYILSYKYWTLLIAQNTTMEHVHSGV